jgi:succinylglutamic semialdehyde dehydrogenase
MGNKVAVRAWRTGGARAVQLPAHLPNGHIVPALIAGNAWCSTIREDPSTGEYLVRCFHEAGVPEGVLRLLIGGPEEGKSLAGQAGIDGLLFTGSVGAGMALHRQFAETPNKILALELGGNNPIVAWDTPMQTAATIIAQSPIVAGQRCARLGVSSSKTASMKV